MNSFLYYFYLVILFVVMPFLLTGIIRKVRAYAQGRRGPKLLQFFWEVDKSLKKKSNFAYKHFRFYTFGTEGGIVFGSDDLECGIV